MDDTAITKRTAMAVGWLSFSRLAAKAIDFCLLLILGRALLPADFGLVALAMTLVVMLDAISELPVAQVIVRMNDPTSEHYDTAFTLATIRAVVLGSACMALAWPFAIFYNDTRLIDLILLLSLAFMSRGLVSPRLAHYARNLDFRRDFIIDMVGKVMSLVCAGTVALVFRSYWAIAAGTVSYWLTTVTASYVVAPYRPRLTLKYAASFGRFLGWSTAAQMVSAVNWQSEKLVLGRFAPATEVGQFSMGSDLANLPIRIFVAPLLVALLPAFSLIRDDAERLKSSYLRVLRSVTMIGIPILVFLCIVAPSATTLLLGSKWTEAAFGLRVLSLASIPAMFVAMIGPLAMALDDTYQLFRRNLFELCIKIPMMTAGAMLGGFDGFLFATAASAVVTNLMSMALVKRLVGISVIQQLASAWRTYVSLIPACAFLIPAQAWLTGPYSWQLFGLGLILVIAGIIFLATDMVLWAWCGRPDGLESMVAPLLRRVLSRVKDLARQRRGL